MTRIEKGLRNNNANQNTFCVYWFLIKLPYAPNERVIINRMYFRIFGTEARKGMVLYCYKATLIKGGGGITRLLSKNTVQCLKYFATGCSFFSLFQVPR